MFKDTKKFQYTFNDILWTPRFHMGLTVLMDFWWHTLETQILHGIEGLNAMPSFTWLVWRVSTEFQKEEEMTPSHKDTFSNLNLEIPKRPVSAKVTDSTGSLVRKTIDEIILPMLVDNDDRNLKLMTKKISWHPCTFTLRSKKRRDQRRNFRMNTVNRRPKPRHNRRESCCSDHSKGTSPGCISLFHSLTHKWTTSSSLRHVMQSFHCHSLTLQT